MGTFLDDLLKKMKEAPHVGVPSVTNPKSPTKVERDTAAYAARQKDMPNFMFGTGTPLERLKARMASSPHPTPTPVNGAKAVNVSKLAPDVVEIWREPKCLADDGKTKLVHWYFKNRSELSLTNVETCCIDALSNEDLNGVEKLKAKVALDDMTRQDYKDLVQTEFKKRFAIELEIDFYNVRYFDAEEKEIYFEPKDIDIYSIGRSDNVFNKAASEPTRTKFYVDKKHQLDNIDKLNPWYCECTGLYYLWKHSKANIVGLEHYRRHFINGKGEILRTKEIKDLLKTHQIIVAAKVYLQGWRKSCFLHDKSHEHIKKFVYEFWKSELNFKDIQKYNDEKNTYFISCNMFITKKEILDKYCTFLFGKIDNFIKKHKIDVTKHPREFGWIAEYTFGYWIEKIEHLKIAKMRRTNEETQKLKHPVTNDKKINLSMKEVLIDLMLEFDKVCRQYDLKYVLDSGTLLGAIRHNGFIPWDDDVDVAMLPEDYEKLMQIGPTAFKGKYFFQNEFTDPGSLRYHCQLRNSNTTGFLKNDYARRVKFNSGIFIDIFPLSVLPNDTLNRQKVFNKCEQLLDARNHESYKKFYEYTNTLRKGDYCAPLWAKFLFKRVMPVKNFLTPVMHDFEAFRFPVPSNPEEILTIQYGKDWKTPQRKPNVHGGLVVDTTKSYKEYLK